MKYKVGDKVRIRTWEDLKNCYGIEPGKHYDCKRKIYFVKIVTPDNYRHFFHERMEKYVKDNYPDRVATIINAYEHNDSYKVDESEWGFQDYMFEGIVKIDEQDCVQSRFELLDI